MALTFREVHAAPDRKKVNEEWFVLENTGGAAVTTGGLAVIRSQPGKRGSVLGMIDPGFTLQPGERMLVVSGIPGKKAQGTPPEKAGMRTYHLFLKEGILPGNGVTLRFARNGVDFARVTYDKDAPDGVGAAG